MAKSVPEVLREAADLFESRNTEYGNAYLNHPQVMRQLFGRITLDTEDDYAEFFRINACIAKINRMARNFPHGHYDSTRDLVVFSAMLQELHESKSDLEADPSFIRAKK